MDKPIQTFIDRILHANGADVRQVARHEAGHRFFWRLMFPDVATHYALRTGDGEGPALRRPGRATGKALPCVVPDRRMVLRIADMSVEDASRYCYVKLGGIAAEIVLLGLQDNAGKIADWVVADTRKQKPLMDWGDEDAHGGDIPDAIRIIAGKTNDDSVAQNFRPILLSCIKNILASGDDFARECAEAESYFAATAAPTTRSPRA